MLDCLDTCRIINVMPHAPNPQLYTCTSSNREKHSGLFVSCLPQILDKKRIDRASKCSVASRTIRCHVTFEPTAQQHIYIYIILDKPRQTKGQWTHNEIQESPYFAPTNTVCGFCIHVVKTKLHVFKHKREQQPPRVYPSVLHLGLFVVRKHRTQNAQTPRNLYGRLCRPSPASEVRSAIPSRSPSVPWWRPRPPSFDETRGRPAAVD